MSAPVSLGEVRAFLRLETDADDALLAGLARAAAEMAEAWLGAPLASDWNAVPEAVRLGVLRLVARMYAERDAGGSGGVPAEVAACWAPWRRLRL